MIIRRYTYIYIHVCLFLNTLKKKAVRLFEQSIESVTIPRHLNSIRQDLIGQIQNVRSCVFEIEGIWSFDYDVEMTFAMNQLTATDDTSLSKQDISKRLVLVSNQIFDYNRN